MPIIWNDPPIAVSAFKGFNLLDLSSHKFQLLTESKPRYCRTNWHSAQSNRRGLIPPLENRHGKLSSQYATLNHCLETYRQTEFIYLLPRAFTSLSNKSSLTRNNSRSKPNMAVKALILPKKTNMLYVAAVENSHMSCLCCRQHHLCFAEKHVRLYDSSVVGQLLKNR